MIEYTGCLLTTIGRDLGVDDPASNSPTVLVDFLSFCSLAALGTPPSPYVPGPGVSLCHEKSQKLSFGNLWEMSRN